MQLRTIAFAFCMAGVALAAQPDSQTGWITDRAHPQVQYRFKCFRGSLAIEWRSGYPGAVTIKTRIKGSGYDGDQDVTIPPGGSTTTDLETLYCTAEYFEMTEKRFSMATPPPATVAAKAAKEPDKPAPALPTVAPWIPPAKVVELTPDLLASVHAGMKRDEVLRAIGNPTSKLAIPEDNALVETYRYPVTGGLAGTVRLSNGVVTEVIVP